jgi:anti-sigma factor RsiW
MDHELDAASSRQLESHIHQCTDCRDALSDFQELDDLVQGLPKIDLEPDFARQMVTMVSEKHAVDHTERKSRLPLFEWSSRVVEDFVDLVISARTPSTGTLDEFSDFPPLSIGHIYFRLMDLSTLR